MVLMVRRQNTSLLYASLGQSIRHPISESPASQAAGARSAGTAPTSIPWQLQHSGCDSVGSTSVLQDGSAQTCL